MHLARLRVGSELLKINDPAPTSERRRRKDCPIEKLLVKAREKIPDDPMTSRKKPESLNKMPSPSEIRRSSPGTRTATKRALLIGVTYKRKYKLKGTINDVKSMRELLINNFGFKEENIRVLTGIFMYRLLLLYVSHPCSMC